MRNDENEEKRLKNMQANDPQFKNNAKLKVAMELAKQLIHSKIILALIRHLLPRTVD